MLLICAVLKLYIKSLLYLSINICVLMEKFALVDHVILCVPEFCFRSCVLITWRNSKNCYYRNTPFKTKTTLCRGRKKNGHKYKYFLNFMYCIMSDQFLKVG